MKSQHLTWMLCGALKIDESQISINEDHNRGYPCVNVTVYIDCENMQLVEFEQKRAFIYEIMKSNIPNYSTWSLELMEKTE